MGGKEASVIVVFWPLPIFKRNSTRKANGMGLTQPNVTSFPLLTLPGFVCTVKIALEL